MPHSLCVIYICQPGHGDIHIKIITGISDSQLPAKQRAFQLFNLGTFRVRCHKLSTGRCTGTISDLVRKLTVDLKSSVEVCGPLEI